MSRLNDSRAVDRQYRESDNFEARVRLYRRYAKRSPSWMAWLFERIALREGERVLDLGCGTGNLWMENAARLPRGPAPLLVDRSRGMLASAGERLRSLGREFRRARADAQQLPFGDAIFDVVIASHMLYHVPDRRRAVAELARTLAPAGRCCIGTNDRGHLIEMRELVSRFEIDHSMMRAQGDDGGAAFDLEAAADEFAARFPSVHIARREERLQVDDAAVIGDYLRSACPDDPDNLARIADLESHVVQHIARKGAFPVTVAAGVCVAAKTGGRTPG